MTSLVHNIKGIYNEMKRSEFPKYQLTCRIIIDNTTSNNKYINFVTESTIPGNNKTSHTIQLYT